MDGNGITNVHKPGKIVATKGARHISKVTSGERGATVTLICAMNAPGGFLLAMLILPRDGGNIDEWNSTSVYWSSKLIGVD